MSRPDEMPRPPDEDATLKRSLHGVAASAEAAPADLLERVCSEQVERWLAGERVPAEEFLARHPALRGLGEAAFELVYGEFVLRESLGEEPSAEEYAQRFPQFADRFRRQLELHGALQPTMRTPQRESPAAPPRERAARVLPVVPGYEVFEELGRGGMGVVYKARHLALKRLVALKVFRGETPAGAEGAARFRAEAEAVARFQHPNIVQIYEVGEHHGLRYLALEYVAGGNLQQRLAGTPRDAGASAQLVEAVARAIHYAHQRGVVHRDLKPANILLLTQPPEPAGEPPRETSSLFPGVGRLFPKITDFGLAKLLEQKSGDTVAGVVMGTPSYMAPEQARARGEPVTPATDVWALGAILYELLTGHPPFQGSSPFSTLEQVCTQDPLPPSKLQRRTPRDLETGCLKCLQKDPRKRYPSARDLADDLRRFTQGRPVKARRAGRVERLWRLCRREPVKAGLLAALLIVLLGGAAGVVTQWQRAEGEAQAQAEARGRAVLAEAEARENLYISLIAQARLEWRLDNVAQAERLLEHCERRRRGWEWRYLRGVNRPDLLGATDPSLTLISGLAFSPDGLRLAFTGWGPGNPVEIWDAAAGKRLHRLAGPDGPLRLSFSPDGTRLATVSGKGEATVWDVDSGRRRLTWQAGGSVAFSPRPLEGPPGAPGSKGYLASGGAEAVTLWDAETGKEIRRYPSPGGRVTFSPDGKLLAISGPQAVEVREPVTGRLVRRLARGPEDGAPDPFFTDEGPDLAFSPDGTRLVVATSPPRVWDVTTGRPLHFLAGHTGAVPGVAFSPDSRQVASAGADGTVRLWDAASGAQLVVLRGHQARASSVCFHPDGWCLASGGRQPGDVQVWDLTRHPEYLAHDHVSAEALAFAPDNQRLLLVNAAGRVQARDPISGAARTGARLDYTDEWLSPSQLAAYSADGRRLATVCQDRRTVKVWESDGDRRVAALEGLSFKAVHVALDRAGGRAAATSLRGGPQGPWREVRVWDVGTGQALAAFTPGRWSQPKVHGVVALSPDGRFVAFDDYAVRPGDRGARPAKVVVRVYAVDGPRELLALPVEAETVYSLAFSPSGRLLAAGTEGQKILLWDTATGARIHEADHPEGPARRLAFSPDNRRLAGLDRDQVMVWDVRSRKRVLVMRVAPPRPFDGGFNPALAWSHDSRWLVTTNWEGGLSAFDGGGEPPGPGLRRQVPEARVYAWHLRGAEAAAAARQGSALAFHLKRLRSAESPDLDGRLRRARLELRAGALDRAAADFAQVFAATDPDSEADWLSYAHAQLLRGDLKGYRALCSRLAGQARADGQAWRWAGAVRACALHPAAADDAAFALRLAERRLARARPGAKEPRSDERLALGLAHYRAGEWDRAVAHLQEAARADRGLAPVAWPALAMAHHRKGQAREAQAFLKQAAAWRAEEGRRLAEGSGLTPAGVNPDFEILYAEAVALLGH
jgi:WD40 repeat protein/tetratricopeptide (TPR) repeat protein